MIKSEELTNPESCLNKAHSDEVIFVLLERDECFEETVRFWARRRIEKGINHPLDAKIIEAQRVAAEVEASRQ